MQKAQFKKIVIWSTAALVIPILGQLFVNGWNWGLSDFLFAWVFFNLLGVTYTVVTNKIVYKRARIAAGIVVVGIFAFIWAILATG